MYALMQLVGVVVAIGTDRWLQRRSPGRRDHRRVSRCSSGCSRTCRRCVLAAGVFWVAGLARDRAAWWWRAAVVTPVARVGRAVGQHVRPSGERLTGELDPAHVGGLVPAVGRPAAEPLRRPGSADRARDRSRLGDRRPPGSPAGNRRRDLLRGAGPARGGRRRVRQLPVQPRTLAFAAWAPLLAIAVLVDAVARRSRLVGLAAFVLVAGGRCCPRPSRAPTTASDYGVIDATNAHLRAVVHPGDVVAIRPALDAVAGRVEPGCRAARRRARRDAAGRRHSFAMRLGRTSDRPGVADRVRHGDRVVVRGRRANARAAWNNDTHPRPLHLGAALRLSPERGRPPRLRIGLHFRGTNIRSIDP